MSMLYDANQRIEKIRKKEIKNKKLIKNDA